MAKRMVYYSAQTYVRQLLEGQSYNSLQPAICICVLAGALYSQPAELHLDFRLREKSHPLTLTDDLQIHFLQLNHLQVTAETLYNATAVERWCWFLCNADQLTIEQVAQLFPDQEFSEAAGVLDMIARTPEQLQEYHDRLKARRDEEARILYGQQQGLEIGEARGIEKGQLRGQVVLLQQLLKQPVFSNDQLAACSAEQLSEVVADLRHRLELSGPFNQ